VPLISALETADDFSIFRFHVSSQGTVPVLARSADGTYTRNSRRKSLRFLFLLWWIPAWFLSGFAFHASVDCFMHDRLIPLIRSISIPQTGKGKGQEYNFLMSFSTSANFPSVSPHSFLESTAVS